MRAVTTADAAVSFRPATAATMACSFQEIQLPRFAWHGSFMKTGGREYGVTDALAGRMLGLLFPEKTHSISLRLGDLVIVGIPGEMAAGLIHKMSNTIGPIPLMIKRIRGACEQAEGPGLADESVARKLDRRGVILAQSCAQADQHGGIVDEQLGRVL